MPTPPKLLTQLTLALLGLGLGACGSNNPRQQALLALGQPDIPFVQAEFKSHVEVFVQEAAVRGVLVDSSKLTVLFRNFQKFQPLSNLRESDPLSDPSASKFGASSLLGECNPDYVFVEIDEKSWKSKGLFAQESILFHELGHCLLNRTAHTSTSLQHRGKVIPKSLMGRYGTTLYNKNSREYYLDELFDRAKAVELSPEYLVVHDFTLEKVSYWIESDTHTFNLPLLAFLDSNGKMKYLDPVQCSILGVTLLGSTLEEDEMMNVSSDLRLQFKQTGNYIVSFDCANDTYTAAFTII